MLALGLDPSIASFGYSIVDTEAQSRARILARRTIRTSPQDFFLNRYLHHERWLSALLDQYPAVTAVGLEAPIFGEEYSEGAYALHISVMRVLRAAGRDVVLILPPQLKALARGHMGGIEMGKADMVSAVKRLVARPNEIHVKLRIDEHQADATLAGWFGARFFELLAGDLDDEELSDAERHVFLREHRISKGVRKGQVERKGLVFRDGDRFFLFSQETPDDRQAGPLQERGSGDQEA